MKRGGWIQRKTGMPRPTRPMNPRGPNTGKLAYRQSKFHKAAKERSGGRCEMILEDGTRCQRRGRVAHHILPKGSHPHLRDSPLNSAFLCDGPGGCDDLVHKTDVKRSRERLLGRLTEAERNELEQLRMAR